jgi:hypothetical protein
MNNAREELRRRHERHEELRRGHEELRRIQEGLGTLITLLNIFRSLVEHHYWDRNLQSIWTLYIWTFIAPKMKPIIDIFTSFKEEEFQAYLYEIKTEYFEKKPQNTWTFIKWKIKYVKIFKDCFLTQVKNRFQPLFKPRI